LDNIHELQFDICFFHNYDFKWHRQNKYNDYYTKLENGGYLSETRSYIVTKNGAAKILNAMYASKLYDNVLKNIMDDIKKQYYCGSIMKSDQTSLITSAHRTIYSSTCFSIDNLHNKIQEIKNNINNNINNNILPSINYPSDDIICKLYIAQKLNIIISKKPFFTARQVKSDIWNIYKEGEIHTMVEWNKKNFYLSKYRYYF
jgi:hypothetical protein